LFPARNAPKTRKDTRTMKKLLLSTACATALILSAPAHAAVDGVTLELGGYFTGYVGYQDQQELHSNPVEVDDIGWLQDSEIHFTGEAALDNGLTVGAHFEMNADNGDGDIEESYVYFQGDWGRVNAGAEDGVAYLLQVAAPSADSNYDGVRQYVNPFNYGAGVVPVGLSSRQGAEKWDYAQDPTAYSNKLTYISPVIADGLQVGLSYAPDVEPEGNDSYGFPLQDDDTMGAAYEGAVRYEGQFDEVGLAIGGGYTLVELEDNASTAAGRDDRDVWNVGLDVDFRDFGLGAVYKSDDQENLGEDRERDTIVVGADYTMGAVKIGGSWLNEQEDLSASTEIDTDRFTGGAVYEFGPGVTFRGSVSYIYHDMPQGAKDIDGTAVLLGTQVNF
jgi:outer membrane protein OmpU